MKTHKIIFAPSLTLPRKTGKGIKGFTLFEVLIALSILAVTAAGLVKAATDNIRHAEHLENKMLASWIAMNKLTELQVMQAWPSTGDNTDTVEMANREWWVKVEVSQTEEKRLRRVDIRVGLKADTASDEENSISSLTGFIGQS